MSPRPYRLGQRQVSNEQARALIIAATRELLMASDGFSGFSIDAVARMTVYHQFGSKTGLLEALSDSLADPHAAWRRLRLWCSGSHMWHSMWMKDKRLYVTMLSLRVNPRLLFGCPG